MDNENKKLLNDEIRQELETLGAMELGSEPYKIAVDGLAKLMDKAIELVKIDVDCTEKASKREQFEADNDLKQDQIQIDRDKLELSREQMELDSRIKREQLASEQADRKIANIIAVAGIVIPSLITIWGTRASFEFEKEGTVTTIMGRGFINKLLPKK